MTEGRLAIICPRRRKASVLAGLLHGGERSEESEKNLHLRRDGTLKGGMSLLNDFFGGEKNKGKCSYTVGAVSSLIGKGSREKEKIYSGLDVTSRVENRGIERLRGGVPTKGGILKREGA